MRLFKPSLMNEYQQDCMHRFYVAHEEKRLYSIEFRQTCILRLILQTASGAIESLVEIVKDNAGLVQAKSAYLPFELRQILSRAISAAKSSKSTKVESKKESKVVKRTGETSISQSGTPVKHRTRIQSNIKAVARDVTAAVEGNNGGNTETDPECTEES